MRGGLPLPVGGSLLKVPGRRDANGFVIVGRWHSGVQREKRAQILLASR